ncbi:TIGR03862 family flavoprotein [Candidatus Methylospira mobilis]|uniref:TIGR03862 family flavoprotein n=1 Tax=Candidatus Methylospira mobilis TaxID=1808979 RepID=A0A5Q0BN89_9GAMM|nr:TIGR03862 family flavoprotein [Candidatus Methylospira mobilis]QFY43701.1 TIGR03862 family flavoprotein [Candidatus Methylospira mobilis]
MQNASIAVIGAGPAGLMAAEVLIRNGYRVHVFDAMPSAGRKLLMAGKGGLNITHSEAFDNFVTRYGDRQSRLKPLIRNFDAAAITEWLKQLAIGTFTGTSGRIFPSEMKSAPLLRAWLRRLRSEGVQFHMRHRWKGWDKNHQALLFDTVHGEQTVNTNATVLTLGGGSWSRLGSDGQWVGLLKSRGIAIADLVPSNCGFDTDWSDHYCQRFQGQALKPVALSVMQGDGGYASRMGELTVTATGLEGSLIYAYSPLLREQIQTFGESVVYLDLLPGKDSLKLQKALAKPRGAKSWPHHLRSCAGLTGAKAGLLREVSSPEDWSDSQYLAELIKRLPVRLLSTRPLDEAISSGGGVCFEALDESLMLQQLPGVFCAGEMLDWEAPTGGYLLTACLASGRAAGHGVIRWLDSRS